MKKFFYLFPVVLMMFAFASCSDDDDLPQVEISTNYSGATMVDGTLYVVQDSTFSITSVTATAIREGKKAGITSIIYGVDGWDVGVTDLSPFAITFDPGSFQTGKHLLSMRMTIAEEGCELAYGYYATDFVVVATADEIPSPDATTPQGIIKTRPSIQE